MSKQAFEFGFKVGPINYTDTLPWTVWGQVPKLHRPEVLKEYRDAIGAFVGRHVPKCRSCNRGWFDPFGNHVQRPCYIFDAIGSTIRRAWHTKLMRSIKIMRDKQQASGPSQ